MILIPILISKPPGITYAYSLTLLSSFYRSESRLPECYKALKRFAELLKVRALLPAYRVPEAGGRACRLLSPGGPHSCLLCPGHEEPSVPCGDQAQSSGSRPRSSLWFWVSLQEVLVCPSNTDGREVITSLGDDSWMPWQMGDALPVKVSKLRRLLEPH